MYFSIVTSVSFLRYICIKLNMRSHNSHHSKSVPSPHYFCAISLTARKLALNIHYPFILLHILNIREKSRFRTVNPHSLPPLLGTTNLSTHFKCVKSLSDTGFFVSITQPKLPWCKQTTAFRTIYGIIIFSKK